jgi:glucose-1-phosphate cytidylyltransferase|tara:strand:+ start:2303 stop:3007 length:705 start_codon:yes stop_codon:yes gene_type:complete
MKAVILAGGFGTRLSEETEDKPKPMIEIGGKPILWHIMKGYSHYGINDFVICCGYKSEIIQNYVKTLNEKWNVNAVDTGLQTMTGGRLLQVRRYVDDRTFCFTYGDTLNDLKVDKLIQFHKKMKTYATVTACHPPEKYGILTIKDNNVTKFQEKPPKKDEWVNGGFFVLEPEIFDYIQNDETIWENYSMKKLVIDKQCSAYKHEGFYKPMDFISDKNYLQKLWRAGKAPWKVWE